MFRVFNRAVIVVLPYTLAIVSNFASLTSCMSGIATSDQLLLSLTRTMKHLLMTY